MRFSLKYLNILIPLLLLSCGGGGGGGAEDFTPVSTSTSANLSPSVSLTASENSLVINDSLTLSWNSTNTTNCTASGSWSGNKNITGSETIQVTNTGSNTYTLNCSGSNGSSNISIVVIANGFEGVVVDGYIRDAEVYFDTNANFTQESSELSTVSDISGSFSLANENATLIAFGGTDVDSNNLMDNLTLFQKANTDLMFRAITPLTSADFYIQSSQSINTLLGLDADLNINTVDPIATMRDSESHKILYEKGAQITALVFGMQSTVNDIQSTQETSENYFQEFTKILESSYSVNSETVDIESSFFIDSYIDAVILSNAVDINTTNTNNLKIVFSSLLPIISVRNQSQTTIAISNFTTGKFISDLNKISQGTASDGLISNYSSNINALIAVDQNIALEDLESSLFLFSDSANVDEDQTVNINVLENDTYDVTAANIVLEVTPPENGQSLINSDDTISYVPDPDFNGSDSFSYSLTVGTQSDSANVSVSVNPISDTPVISSSATFSAAENQTSIGSVSASDADGDSLTYSISGSEINISSSGVLTFASAPDYETKATYTATVTVNDGTNSTTQAITVSILDVNETPSFSSFSSNVTVNENQISIVTVSGSDFENNSLSYSLSGDDSSSLSINSSSGVITFNSSPDYETNSSYSVVVSITDGNSTISENLNISISNTNDDPVLTVTSPVAIDETRLLNCPDTVCNVTTASGSDQDSGSSFSFSLSGTDQSYFSISSGGLITFNNSPDYEEKPSYSIVVNLSDGNGGTDSENLTVNLNNMQDTCAFTHNSPYYVDTGTTAVDSFTTVEGCGWTLQNNQYDSSSFSITSNGVLSFNSAPDAATKSYYQVYVTHEDDANCCSVNYILTVYVNGNFISALPGTYNANTYATQDNITGGYGNDVIYTYDGDDTLNGGRGADILWGGSGDNTLTGGSEKIGGEPHPVDKFAIKLGSCGTTDSSNWDNTSRVVDFQDTIDKILLLDGLAFTDLTISGSGTTDPIYIRAGNRNLLEISPNQLNQSLNSQSIINLTSDDFITGSSGSAYCD